MVEDGGSVASSVGVLDGAALRERHRARIAKDTSPVTILTGGSARDLGRRICEAKVPHVAADTPIVLKPNLGGFDWFKDAAKSEGDDGVREAHHRSRVRARRRPVPQGSRPHARDGRRGVGRQARSNWVKLDHRVGPTALMAKEEGVPLVAMDDDGVFDVGGDKPGEMLRVTGMEQTTVPTLLSPRLLAEALTHGLFISLPKDRKALTGTPSFPSPSRERREPSRSRTRAPRL